MAITGSPSLDEFILPMIAKASEVLKAGSARGDKLGSVVSLIVVARIIEADMRAMIQGEPSPDLIKQMEAITRLEMERIYTAGWAKH